MKTKALLIGIDKYAQAPLWGCVNDIAGAASLIRECYGVPESNTKILTNEAATRNAILENLKLLCSDIAAGDKLLFYFAGHGTQKGFNVQGELDGKDEAIVPYDMSYATLITDNELFDIIAQPVETSGAAFTAVYDCCHSGTMVRDVTLQEGGMSVVTNRCVYIPLPAKLPTRSIEMAPYCVLSACQDSETAADLQIDGIHRGAFSYALQKALRETPGTLLSALDQQVLGLIRQVSPRHPQNPNYALRAPGTDRFL